MRLFAITLGIALLARPEARAETVWPGGHWDRASPAEAGLDEARLLAARDYALTGGGSGYITRGGKLVLSWGDTAQLYDLKSTSKSIGFTTVGLALKDGKLRLSDKAADRHPAFGVPPEENRSSGWLNEITLFHLAAQTAGFAKRGGYEPLLFRPGTQWSYSDGGPNWLAEIVTLAYGRDIEELMFERVLEPIGVKPSGLRWRKNAYRDARINGIERREFGSGVHANVDAMARLGLLYLRGGQWNRKQILPREFVELVRQTPRDIKGLPVYDSKTYPGASNHYGLLWWNNDDGVLPDVPRDAYWSWGLHDSLIVVIPSLDIVASRAGKGWIAGFGSNYGRLVPFLGAIAAAAAPPARPPYPPSPVIESLSWAPLESIVRKAPGGDNWPLAWADDDALYTAYGDGWGFEPLIKPKLSMGFAKVIGPPNDFDGINIRSDSGERIGQGPAGLKASGLTMIDGVLYLWTRNAGNSQLAWSSDHAQTWTWADWKFTTSFGHPSFIAFGKNYSGARDGYVYLYSQDHHSAYEPSSHAIMARVPKAKITSREAYEFFEGLGGDGKPLWSDDIGRRAPVFRHEPNRFYRSSMSYSPALRLYLWCQIIPGDDTRFAGGFGIYDAPEPWGPWTTAYFTENWDTGPGENCHLPPKWMSADGKTIHMVFSGEDHFSVRKATLELRVP